MTPNRWAIVLAAGEGARIRALTTDGEGRGIPKQFWAPFGTQPMLRWALERAGRIVPEAHVVTIVAAQHRDWWEEGLNDQPSRNVIVQPSNRGTAVGILLPLLKVEQEDPGAIVSILPSDHYVEDEGVLRNAIEHAFHLAEQSPWVVMLGMAPDGADPDYGWIIPGREEPNGARRIVRFVEKPGPALARRLYRRRASWSSFMLVARVGVLLSIFERWAPRTVSLIRHTLRERGWSQGALRPLYAALDSLDFSHDLLERAADQLLLLEVPPCGWTDLGTPTRLARWMTPRSDGLMTAPPRDEALGASASLMSGRRL